MIFGKVQENFKENTKTFCGILRKCSFHLWKFKKRFWETAREVGKVVRKK